MNVQTVRRKVTVMDPMGLHMRPLTAFAQRALQFKCEVVVAKGNTRVNGKSPLELMLLAAPQGAELVLEASGEDAEAAMAVLADLLQSPGHEEAVSEAEQAGGPS